MNPYSIADGAANAWYRAAVRRHPEALERDGGAVARTVAERAGVGRGR